MTRHKRATRKTGQPPIVAPKPGGLIQRAAVNPPPGTASAAAQISPPGTGQPLDPAIRATMEPRFGQDFSGVRIHTDSQAAQSAQALGARAYTVGQDVVFGTGQFAPSSPAGQALLAHELTHVAQDGRARAPDQALTLEPPGSTAER